jgi:PAS domain S-box-containing protein
MHGISDIEKIFSIRIREYTFNSEPEFEAGIRDAKSRGVKLALGGIFVKHYAPAHGLEGILVECGEEAVFRSVREALNVARVRQLERSRAARIKVVLDSIAEGIIVTDEKNIISIYNPAAEKIFRIPSEDVIGEYVQNIIPNTRMHKVFETGEAEFGVLQEMPGGIIATNRIPILLDAKRIGVVSTFENVTKIQQLEEQIRKKIHAKGFSAKYTFKDILTANPHMLELKELAAMFATTDSSVLIQGESGTGKELFAQGIHNASKRAAGPFVAVNCAAIPDPLLESELFGYEGGAFTGARKEGKQGLFELAHRGTIFLDEIGDIPKSLQARLLRALQEKEIMRVGGDRIMPIDTRIISATNKNLDKKAELGEFRHDLYYRLNVFSLKIPPLRNRREDISLLAIFFLRKFNTLPDFEKLEREIRPLLLSYDWPGNVRELFNAMERLSLLAVHSRTSTKWTDMLQKVMFTQSYEDTDITVRVDINKGLKAAVDHVEKSIIDMLLDRYGQDHDLVAKKLGIGRTTLWRKGRT